MAQDVLSNAQDGGTLQSSTIFAVAQTTAGTKLQKIANSVLVWASGLTGSDRQNAVKHMTAKAFTDTVATSSETGTAKLSTPAEIAAKSASTPSIITPNNIDDLFESGIPIDGTITTGDIDVRTDGTGTITDVRTSTYGNFGYIGGYFTFVPNVSTNKAEIYINNSRQPLFAQSGSASFISSALTTSLYPLGVIIEPDGTPTGIGTTKITLSIGGINWSSGISCTIWLNIHYAAKI